MHSKLLFAFSRAEALISFIARNCHIHHVMRNKRIDHVSKIMSNRPDIFTDNYTIFPSNTENTGKVPEFEYNKF